IGFSINAQLVPVTENSNTGQRLTISNALNHGNIGFNALDLSFSDSSSSTRGATGNHSFATGYITIASGIYSTAMGEGTTASGNRTLATGYSTTASGNRSTAIGNSTTANGYSSTAIGNNTTASGNASIAMGSSTTAEGVNSTAIGNNTTASGNASLAMGLGTTAFGTYSTAMGNSATASDFVSLVIGQYNSSGSSVTSSATEFDTANTAFVIGNGTGSSSKSDAFKVLFNGNTTATGSVTATSFIGDGSQLSGIGILSAVTENNQTGARLSISNASNHGNIGSEALDLSYSNSASTTLGATGAGSIAMGLSTTASGAGSIAMGLSTVSSADATLAMGNNTTASGDGATAMGFGTVASGSYSSAIGRRTTASDFGSLVIGQHNSSGSSVTNSATAFNTANTAFVIGNGENDSSKSDAFKVLFNGNTTATGSVTATSFIGDGSQLSNLPSASIAFTDLTSTPTTIDGYGITDAGTGILSPVTENSNTGARLSTSNASNHGNIGSNAVDLSYTASASTTKGATGNYSIAMGRTTTASGDHSTAMGRSTTASGANSTAIGNSTTASGASSTAIGNSTTASAFNSTAIGNSTTASGSTSIAMGSNSTASGANSAAMGSNSTASDYGSLVIGQYNSSGSSVTNSATAFNTANTAFVIGNGTNGSNQSDAFKVLFSGETTIGSDLEVKGNVLVSSDARLKANIVSLGSTLAKLLLIDGKRYTMKKDGKQNIGVLAQDIQKVFPELVSTDDRDMLAVNYQGLVPVLINGLKEQDAKMKEQDAKMKEQQKRLERLEAIISDK
ncbi:tail fiber domain-containing protein, partial [Flavobacteriaceae bacterium]|nr:tail fiber domain-containing protein [Flavobacteriaceae bacterium]